MQEHKHRFVSQQVNRGNEPDTDGYDRGTCVKISNRNALLWTRGVVPSVRASR